MKPSHGVKIDFVVAYERHLSTEQVRNSISNALSAPIIGTCDIPGCRQDHSHALRVSRKKYADPVWSLYESWTIPISAEEKSAAQLSGHEVCLCTFSLSSPGRYSGVPDHKLFNNEGDLPDHNPWYSSESEIRCVLARLNAINERGGDDGILALYTNKKCSLQIHIGSGLPSRGISPIHVKRILQFFTIFERALDSVQNTNRIRYGPMDALWFFNLLSDPTFGWTQLRDCLAYFPVTKSLIKVDRLLMDREHAVNRTLEFSQHMATLNAEEVLAWLDLIESIVEWVTEAQATDLQEYYSDKWYDIHHLLPQILADVGAKPETIDHYMQVLAANGHYECDIYNSAVNPAYYHPMFELLRHAARERLMSCNGTALAAAITAKLLNGDYGWLPVGSPHARPGTTLPIYSYESMYSYKTALMLSSEDDSGSPISPGRSIPSSTPSMWEVSDDELEPDDSVSQVGKQESPEFPERPAWGEKTTWVIEQKDCRRIDENEEDFKATARRFSI